MSARDWLWWPTTPTHSVACGVALVVVSILGILEIPQFPNFKLFTAVQASAAGFFGLWVLIAVFNACIFFVHARGDYLTGASSLRPVGLTFALLALVFPLAWGTYRLIGAGAPPLDIHALAVGVTQHARGIALSPAAGLQWTRVMRGIFVGEAGLAMVLLFSVLWKAPPQDTLELSAAWSRVQPLVWRVFRDGQPLDVGEHERLKAALKIIADGAEKLDTRALRPRDLNLAARLSAAAGRVLVAVHRPHGALINLRTTDDAELLAAVQLILGELQQ